MDDSQRLELICEAVRYCQRVTAFGMPSSCYSKALREPIHFLWERRSGARQRAARFRSRATEGLRYGKGEVVHDQFEGKSCSISLDSVRPAGAT
jgi:hypothetical protein